MHAAVGDRIEILTGTVDRPPRQGTVREVLGMADVEHFLVTWDDGHESVLYPGPDTHVIRARATAEQPLPEPRAGPTTPRSEDPVERIMRTPVVTVDEDDSLRTAAAALADAEIGALVVLSGTTPLGLLSEHDVVHAIAAGGDPDEVWCAHVIGTSVVWASPTDTIGRVAALMRDADVRHIPLRADDSVVGMASIRDVHRALFG